MLRAAALAPHQSRTRASSKTLVEDLKIAEVKGPRERTLLENSDPEYEPVTPACSLNPPTVSEREGEISAPFPISFSSLSGSTIEEVEKFVYFIGYGRSDHSIIASMLDAHPNIIIAHEYSVFEKQRTIGAATFSKDFLFNELYWNSYENAFCRDGWRNAGMDMNGYTLDMPGLWQGRFKQLQVIGDNAAGYTAMEYHNSPTDFIKLHSQFLHTIGIPIRVIHVVRNPYDIIANELLYMESGRGHGTKTNVSSDRKIFDLAALKLSVNRVLTKAEAVFSMSHALELAVLDICIEDFIQNPKAIMQKLCDFLAINCSQDYLQKCYSKAFKKISRTRDSVWWPGDLRRRVEKESKRYSFFRRYTFKKDF